MSDDPPPLAVRWMRPQTATAFLELPIVPIVASSQKDISWQAFTEEESEACETAWAGLSANEKAEAEADESDDVSNDVLDEGQDEEEEDKVGVSIAKDKLFEVDVRSMKVSCDVRWTKAHR